MMTPEKVEAFKPNSNPAIANKGSTLLDTWDPRLTRELHNLRPHPATGRLIDSYPGTRTRPMRVLCLGMSRTGTMTLFKALQGLGFNPYHMAVAMGSPKTNLSLWTEALNAKYHGKGKKWGQEEFDKILGSYDCVLDVPCICFAEELVAAYPEAKIVLSTRDIEGWMKSMDNSAGVVHRWNWSQVARWDSNLAGPFFDFAKLIMPIQFGTITDFSSPRSPARKAFKDHYDKVRQVAPKKRLLEYTVQEEWKPLCDFLAVNVPDETFPRVNDAKQFVYAHALMWWLALAKMVGKIGVLFAIPCVGVAVAWTYGH